MMRPFLALIVLLAASRGAAGQESLKVESRKQAPPSAVSTEITGVLEGQSIRIQDEKGEPFAEIWLRRATPGDKPSGPKGAIQFPFLADGELLGVLEFGKEGHDYRDQPVPKGVYTMLQPVNGDHLGVSTYRDYVLLLPATVDKNLPPPVRKKLEERSAEAAGTNHPASFLLLMAPPGSKPEPAVLRDADKDTWSVVLPLKLQAKGAGAPLVYPVQLIVLGVAAA
ncbi:MAG: hypothetical protein ACYC61_09590 [Isosphaeraceae bacterium]